MLDVTVDQHIERLLTFVLAVCTNYSRTGKPQKLNVLIKTLTADCKLPAQSEVAEE